MAISTYAELQTALTNWTQRSDISSRSPEWIAMAEAAFNRGFDPERPFRHSSQEASTTIAATTTVGIFTGFPLPTDFLELRAIRTTTSPYRKLTLVTPEQMDLLWTDSTTGTPYSFTFEAGIIRTGPSVAGASIQITYYQKIVGLATTSPNWLLTNHPDVYLFGALLHGHVYSQNDPQLPTVISGYNTAVSGLRSADRARNFSGGAMQIVAA